ncbi:hypothetical protein B0T21DRAFT_343583 [Apiosordaria backusii]|uniref:Uncharacterized protein n=1 Tax=Apiosordaria backusii TaxID=314023 RepID=A0AA40K6M7_9PEZI|nr:hypothetical protein B0T21DRAFT_343583 [Apiosordaria backusii]
MLACAEFYRIASEIYYGRNTFHLRLNNNPLRYKVIGVDEHGNPKHVAELGKVGQLLLGRSTLKSAGGMESSESPRLRLRHVVVRLQRFGGAYIENEFIPALGYLVLNGRLQQLEVELLAAPVRVSWLSPQDIVYYPGYTPRPAPPPSPPSPPSPPMRSMKDLSGNPVMKALLVVLMDPDLVKASMRVEKNDSPSVWCQCSPWRERSEDTPPMCVLKHLPGENRCRRQFHYLHQDYWAEVDIPKLVQACGIDSAEFNQKGRGPRSLR